MRNVVSRRARGLKRVLFLCPDNYSLGRFCEEYFNSIVRNEGQNWQAASRATSLPERAPDRPPMDRAAVSALREFCAAPVNHERQPQPLSRRDIAISDLLIGVCIPPIESCCGGTELVSAPRIELWQPDAATGTAATWGWLADRTLSLIARLDARSRHSDDDRARGDDRWSGFAGTAAVPASPADCPAGRA